jgi:hypothetical protein
MDNRREVWNSVRLVLENAKVDALTLALVKEKFYPSILGFPRPNTRNFKAAVTPEMTTFQANRKAEYFSLTYATNLPLRDDCEYRVISALPANAKGEQEQVVLVTPLGQDTKLIKHEIYDLGWDAFYSNHPDWEMMKVSDLERVEYNPEAPPTERALMFDHYPGIGRYRKTYVFTPQSKKTKESK